jgi:hypothetical protein
MLIPIMGMAFHSHQVTDFYIVKKYLAFNKLDKV